MTPDISTVIPTFRRPTELCAAISSVLGQTGASVELIVVDDCPQGSARSIAESFKDRRITYIHNPHATGGIPAIVRNLGFSHTTAALIHFLDDDDVVPEGHYARALKRFAARPAVGLVFGAVQPFGDGPAEQLGEERKFFKHANRLASFCRASGSRLTFVSAHLFRNVLLVCSAGILRRQCVSAIGGFDPALRMMEDADFYTFVMRRFDADFIDDPAIHYRISSRQSLMHTALANRDATDTMNKYIHEARQKTFSKYRTRYGRGEFLALKLLARTALRVI